MSPTMGGIQPEYYTAIVLMLKGLNTILAFFSTRTLSMLDKRTIFSKPMFVIGSPKREGGSLRYVTTKMDNTDIMINPQWPQWLRRCHGAPSLKCNDLRFESSDIQFEPNVQQTFYHKHRHPEGLSNLVVAIPS